MSYTTILYMLDVAGIPLLAKDRGDEYPIIQGGGPCACNPEPLADFFDLFVINNIDPSIKEISFLGLTLYRLGSRNDRKPFLNVLAFCLTLFAE